MKYLKKFLEKIVENDTMKLWHYSNKKITDYIKPGQEPNLHSNNPGISKCYFYTKEDGYKTDRMSHLDYKYICYIPKEQIYDIDKNKNKYSGTLEMEIPKKLMADGYTAWIHNLRLGENNSIVESFKPVKISESYMRTEGGEWVPLDWKKEDYKVGTIKINNDQFDVYQKDGFLNRLSNLYYLPEPNNIGYKKPIYDYMSKDIKFFDDYKDKYL